jgi:glycosyltransferase involved in cell wall biosynthesis
MKVLFLSTSDISGGAAIAANRLFRAISCDTDIDVSMCVMHKFGCDPKVLKPKSDWGKLAAHIIMPIESALIKRVYRRAHISNFMPARLPDGLRKRIDAIGPDLLHVHWVGQSFLRPETLKGIGCPIVWTLHDMWALTGGCYYDGGCGGYKARCGKCPELGSIDDHDLSRRVWNRKQAAWRDLNLTLVSPSRWLADCATASSLHATRRIEVIPNCVSEITFRPWPKSTARQMLGLPKEAKLVLFGAAGVNSPRKGFIFLSQALQKLAKDHPDLELVVFGGHLESASLLPRDIRLHSLGQLRDELTTALAYAAADIFVAPSLEDNLPNTVVESAMCGTPVVAFRVGGIPDIIAHEQHGLLVEPGNSSALAYSIRRLLNDDGLRHALGQQARIKAEIEYGTKTQTKRYMALYRSLLSTPRLA